MTRLAILLAVLTGCSEHSLGGVDTVIGAGCTRDSDCAHRCYLDPGNRFPGWFCSQACASDADCPIDTYCATTAGGLCLFACPAFDCARLGVGYQCRQEDHISGGSVMVCLGN
jgi:hypothetical protein